MRERLVSQRTGIINQIRAFLLERGVAVRQGMRFLRIELPGILATRSYVLSSRMMQVIEDLAGDWRQLDERIEVHEFSCLSLLSAAISLPAMSKEVKLLNVSYDATRELYTDINALFAELYKVAWRIE